MTFFDISECYPEVIANTYFYSTVTGQVSHAGYYIVNSKKERRYIKPIIRKWQKTTTSGEYYIAGFPCSLEGKNTKTVFYHRLVAYFHIGCPIGDFEVNHINHNSLDNSISNLEYVTHRENCEHFTKDPKWEKNHYDWHNPLIKRTIIEGRKKGKTWKELSKELGIKLSVLSRQALSRGWADSSFQMSPDFNPLEEELDRIKELREANVGWTDIAKEFNITEGQAMYSGFKAGVKKVRGSKYAICDQHKKSLLKEIKKGSSWKDAGILVGLDGQTVRAWFRARGFKKADLDLKG